MRIMCVLELPCSYATTHIKRPEALWGSGAKSQCAKERMPYAPMGKIISKCVRPAEPGAIAKKSAPTKRGSHRRCFVVMLDHGTDGPSCFTFVGQSRKKCLH